MKKILTLLFFVFVIFNFVGSVSSQTLIPTQGARFASCDQCGYCPPNPAPGSWAACQKCLYPNLNPNPKSNQTLAVNPTTGLQVSPVPGHMYTFLGCLSSGGGSFSQTGGGGAGGVAQALLKVVFSTVGGIAFLYLIYGSFIIISSQNDPEKLNYGKRVVWGAIAGLIFSLMSVFLVNLIAGQVLQVPGFGSTTSP
jgi:hypothetical protein